MIDIFEEINYLSFDNETRPFGLEMSGISYCDGSYYIKRSKSRISVIEYVEKGTGTVIFDGKVYTASAGDVYILPAGHSHEYYSSADDPWVKKFFNINGELFPELLKSYSLDGVVVIRRCEVKQFFDSVYDMSRRKEEISDINRFYDSMAVKMHELLIQVRRYAASETEPDELLKVKNYIDSNIERIVSNDELSALIFRSNDYLIKSFRLKYAQTPYDYQIDRKIVAAKRLLKYTLLPIGEVSRRLGYSDQHYFSNLFKQKCGISPMQYRKTKK